MAAVGIVLVVAPLAAGASSGTALVCEAIGGATVLIALGVVVAARRLPGAWTDALPFLATLLVTVAALDPLPILLLAPLYLLTAVWGAAFLAVRPAVANAAAGIVSLGMLAAADGTRTALATWLSAAVAISGATTATAWSAARARRAAARQAVLRRVAVAVAANSRHEPVLDLVAREAARWLSADGAGLVRFRDGVGEAVGWWGAGARAARAPTSPSTARTCSGRSTAAGSRNGATTTARSAIGGRPHRSADRSRVSPHPSRRDPTPGVRSSRRARWPRTSRREPRGA